MVGCIRGLCRIRTALLVWGYGQRAWRTQCQPPCSGLLDGFNEPPIKQPSLHDGGVRLEAANRKAGISICMVEAKPSMAFWRCRSLVFQRFGQGSPHTRVDTPMYESLPSTTETVAPHASGYSHRHTLGDVTHDGRPTREWILRKRSASRVWASHTRMDTPDGRGSRAPVAPYASRCGRCGTILDRDYNAALNILDVSR